MSKRANDLAAVGQALAALAEEWMETSDRLAQGTLLPVGPEDVAKEAYNRGYSRALRLAAGQLLKVVA